MEERGGDNGTTTAAFLEAERLQRGLFLRAPILHINRCGPTLANKAGPDQRHRMGVLASSSSPNKGEGLQLPFSFRRLKTEGNDRDHICDIVNKHAQKRRNELAAQIIFVLGLWDW